VLLSLPSSHRKNGLPVVLHAHYRPTLGLGLIQRLVEPSDAPVDADRLARAVVNEFSLGW
jgi:hypothetical protein